MSETAQSAAAISVDKLNNVFQKAVDVAINSISEADLESCFGRETKSKFGNVMNKLFMNMLVKTQNNMQVLLVTNRTLSIST